MAFIPETLRYTPEHEYVMATSEQGEYLVGITDFAQNSLGDVVFVDLPGVGTVLRRSEMFGTIEAVKAVSELYSPVSGEVVAVNGRLETNAEWINHDPYGDGWMIRIRLSAPDELDELLRADAYKTLLE